MALKEYLSLQEYADITGTTKQAVYNRCKRGEIDGAFKVGKLWRIPKIAESSKMRDLMEENIRLKTIIQNLRTLIDSSL